MSAKRGAGQTLSFLMHRFEEVGIHPQKRLGQNFLIDLNLLDVLLAAAEIGPDDVVLEVGTGTGSLSQMLASRAAQLITVELDPQLFQLASEELIDYENVTMFHTDILKNKNRLNPEILEAIDAALSSDPDRKFKLAANLPYNVATPIITNLLALDRPPERMTVTIQKELADRIVARPRTKDYSALSIWVQSQSNATIERIMPPNLRSSGRDRKSTPPSSASIRIQTNASGSPTVRPSTNSCDPSSYDAVMVAPIFFHRRKFLRANLLSATKDRLSKPQVDALMQSMDLAPNARSEELEVETMIRLFEQTMKAMISDSGPLPERGE